MFDDFNQSMRGRETPCNLNRLVFLFIFCSSSFNSNFRNFYWFVCLFVPNGWVFSKQNICSKTDAFLHDNQSRINYLSPPLLSLFLLFFLSNSVLQTLSFHLLVPSLFLTLSFFFVLFSSLYKHKTTLKKKIDFFFFFVLNLLDFFSLSFTLSLLNH